MIKNNIPNKCVLKKHSQKEAKADRIKEPINRQINNKREKFLFLYKCFLMSLLK